jgi:hypothetical protein
MNMLMMNEHLKLLELAASNGLPGTIDEKAGLPLDIVRELVEAGYLKAIDASSFEGDAYMSPKITLSGREYLERLKFEQRSDADTMISSPIRLFISHSAADRDLVERLVELLRSALGLPASQIRCTSVDGYRLPAGADTAEQLRLEVHEATAFVGVISASSLRSLYVAFELGARWGAKRPLFPLLAPGTEPSILEGPLASLNALSSASRAQLHQLISDLSAVLRVKSEEPAVYQRHVEAVLALSKVAAEPTSINPIMSPIPEVVAGSLADIKVSFDKQEITAKLHTYSFNLSVKWQGPRDQDFFNISLLWPKVIRISKQVGFERGDEEEIDGVVYEELSLFVEKRLWPQKTIKAIGGKAAAQLEYVFDDETHRRVHGNLKPKAYKLYYKFYSQEWLPIEGEVSFRDLNVY